MINKHCGKFLEYEYGRFTDLRLLFHQWKCPVCGKRFKQRIRRSKEEVMSAMKLQRCRYQVTENGRYYYGVAKVKEWGYHDVEWIIDANGERVNYVWQYLLENGPMCYLEVR